MSDNKTAIRQYLIDEMGLDDDIEDDEPLFSNKRLDSIDVLRLIVFLEKTFNIKYNPLDVSLESFDTISKISATVECRQS